MLPFDNVYELAFMDDLVGACDNRSGRDDAGDGGPGGGGGGADREFECGRPEAKALAAALIAIVGPAPEPPLIVGG